MRRAAIAIASAIVLASACSHQRPPAQGSGAPPETAGSAPASSSAVGTAAPADTGNAAPEPPSTAHVPADLPLGLSRTLYAIAVPADRVPTPEMARLGDQLFDDKRLSVDGTVSCSTCHDPKAGFVDHKTTSVGVGKQQGQRNAPTVLNAMFNATQFWDGRAPTLEEQAKLPILNPIEMGQKSPDDVVAKVRSIPEYTEAFHRLIGRDPTYDDIARAIASFERTKFAGDAPFDRYISGQEDAIDASARRGWALFNGKGRCTACHAVNATSPLFSDQKFHNIGIAAHKQDFTDLARKALAVVKTGDKRQIDELVIQTDFSELGRFMITKNPADVGAFKTPTLRNVAITGPYMHDGSMDTLWDVMDHYNKGGVPNPFLDGGMQRLGLTEPEIDDLVRFMTTLTSDTYAAFAQKEMARQTARKGVRPQRDTAVATGQKGDLGDIAPNPTPPEAPAHIGAYGPVHQPAQAPADAGASHGQ
jgi:cytochrome c peroxidase